MYRGTMKNLPRGTPFNASADRIKAEGQRRRDEAELRSAMKDSETKELEADADRRSDTLPRGLASFIRRIRGDGT
jgi:hypothetical protein